MDPQQNLGERLRLAERIVFGRPTPEDLERYEELREAAAEWALTGGWVPPLKPGARTLLVGASERAMRAAR